MNKKDIAIVSSGILTLLVTILLSLSWTEEWSGLTKWAFGIMLYSEISGYSEEYEDEDVDFSADEEDNEPV